MSGTFGRASLERALLGYFDTAVGAAPEAHESEGWAWCIAIARASATAEDIHTETIDRPGPGFDEGAALAARRSLVEMEPDSARRWLAARPHPCLSLRVEQTLTDLDEGRLLGEAATKALAQESRRAGDARALIAATVARAWQAEAAGELEGSLGHARQAARMARTEGLPQSEYFASISLARCRRLIGHPHLAVRILRALARYAPAQWFSWIAWEMLLAGALETAAEVRARSPFTGGATDAFDAATALIRAARSGSTDSAKSCAKRLTSLAQRSARVGRDCRALLAVIGLNDDPTVASIETWLRGDVQLPPRGLHGLAAGQNPDASLSKAVVYVAAQPGQAGRRVLAPGHHLKRAHRLLEQTRRRQGRLDTAVAVLALAGPEGLPLESVFVRVYEFNVVEELHRGALRKLLARANEWLEDLGGLEVARDHITLNLRSPLLVADPRSVVPVDVRVLAVLAEDGATSARDAAKKLRIPLRTAQAALQDLLSDGTAERKRQGNAVIYQVEDTVFSEPTRHS
ncbi:MAG: hypothetical protein AAF938_22080 [Myxococcota bacterium]